MKSPANYSRALSGERSGRACYLQIFDKLPSPKDDYYKLEPMFTSDGADATNPIYYYSLVEDGYDVTTGNKKYTKYGKPVFRFVGDNFELYNYSATQEFKLVDGDVVERISKYKNCDLFYSEETKRIYTFANDGFYLLFDTIPYQGLLYIDGRYSDHAAYLWNSAKEDFEVASSSGSAGSALPLFAHVLSDRRLESVGWAESDSFSKQSAILYTDAYKYLKDQLHPVGSMLAGGKVGDSLSAAENATWLIEWSDNFYENTNVSLALSESDARFAVIDFCNSKLGEYTIDNAVYEYDPDLGRNIIVDVVLVGVLKFGAIGAAIATISSQAISFIISLIYMIKKGFSFEINKKHFKLDKESVKYILIVGFPLALQDALVNISFLIISIL